MKVGTEGTKVTRIKRGIGIKGESERKNQKKMKAKTPNKKQKRGGKESEKYQGRRGNRKWAMVLKWRERLLRRV